MNCFSVLNQHWTSPVFRQTRTKKALFNFIIKRKKKSSWQWCVANSLTHTVILLFGIRKVVWPVSFKINTWNEEKKYRNLDEKFDKIGEGMFGSRLFIGNFSRSIKNIHRGCAKNKSSGLLQMIFFSCLLEVINNCHHIFFWGGKALWQKPSKFCCDISRLRKLHWTLLSACIRAVSFLVYFSFDENVRSLIEWFQNTQTDRKLSKNEPRWAVCYRRGHVRDGLFAQH